MARTNLPLTNMQMTATGAPGSVLNTAGTAIDATNGMNIQIPASNIPAPGSGERLLLYVQNTTASVQTVTVRKGVGGGVTPGPAFRSGKGDFVTANLNATTGLAFIGPFEPAIFAQLDGSFNVDFSAGMTGTIYAILLQRAF